MVDFYAGMASTALRLIDQFGSVQTLRETVPGTYDPVTGASTGDTEKTQSATLILQDYSANESGQSYADGSEIRRSDKKIIIAAKGLAWPPSLTTTVDIDGTLWRVVNVKQSNPAGTPLVYFCQGRK